MSIRNIINTTQLQISTVVFVVALVVSGCSLIGVPWPVSVMTTVGDVVSVGQTGKSLSENAASKALERDCQWSRILKGWAPCLTQDELAERLLEMNCDTYAWNIINIPYCKE